MCRICMGKSKTSGQEILSGNSGPRNHLHPPLWCAAFVSARRPNRVRPSLLFKVKLMSDHVVPHFHNDAGVPVIEIGSREFMCVGAQPPFDHPHVFLDLGNDNEIICPYCSTLYRFAADLGAGEARPPECVLKDKVA